MRSVQLRRLVRVVNGGTPTADELHWGGGIPWATPVDLGRHDGRSIGATERTLTDRGLETGSSLVPERSIILSTRAPIGYVCVNTVAMAFNQGCRGLIPRSNVSPEYLRYALLHLRPPLQAAGTGSTFMELSTGSLASMPVPVVGDRVRQDAVADFLDRETAKIDALIAKQERLVAALADRMTAEASSLVWRGLSDHELAPSGIDPAGDSPSHWRRLRNKDVLFERVQLSAAGDEELLTVSHLTGIRRRADSTVNMFEAESTEGYKQVEAGDLVINTLWAWMGALGVSELDGIVSPAYGVYTVRPGASVEPAYLHHLMRSPAYVTEMTRHSKGVWTSRLRLYPASFLGLNLVLPPLAEQHTIVAHLNERQVQTQVLIAKAKELISVMRERRAALITAAVTGKLDLTTYGKAG